MSVTCRRHIPLGTARLARKDACALPRSAVPLPRLRAHVFDQTFRGTYWQKRPDLDSLVQESGHSCAGDRQMAMMFNCSHTTIAKKVERLGRPDVEEERDLLLSPLFEVNMKGVVRQSYADL